MDFMYKFFKSCSFFILKTQNWEPLEKNLAATKKLTNHNTPACMMDFINKFFKSCSFFMLKTQNWEPLENDLPATKKTTR